MLTVLIATYNGARTLPSALEAYCQLQTPPGGWKLVIVDNGSTDHTKQIVQSFADRLPLSYVFESSRGKNVALNTGLAYLEGDLVVLTDDDTLPRPDWLIEMRRAADCQTSFSVFGGTVVPRWEVPPQEWLLSEVRLDQVFSLTDPSWIEGPLPYYFIFGTNMAIRAEVFNAGYRFNIEIGPSAGNYVMGSETELTLRLEKAGYQAWHCRRAVVEHMIRKFQMNRSWIVQRAIRYGRSKYRLTIQYENANRKELLGVPGYLLRELVKKALAVAGARVRGDAAELFKKRWIFNYLLGQSIEARMIHKGRRSTHSV